MCNFLSPGSGEYAVNAMLAVGGFARESLIDRVHDLTIPVTFMYGDRDWMDIKAAYEIQSRGLVKDLRIEIIKDCSH